MSKGSGHREDKRKYDKAEYWKILAERKKAEKEGKKKC